MRAAQQRSSGGEAEHQAGTVAILLATHDGEAYLERQLASIEQQSHQDWLLIVADDGSKDRTHAILHAFAESRPERIRLLDVPPVYSAKLNFFRLLSLAPDCDYVALADQDDEWDPDKLRILVSACQHQEAVRPEGTPLLVHSDLRVVDSGLREISPSFMTEIRTNPERATLGGVMVENHVPGCSLLVNRALMNLFRSAPIDPKNAVMHDWWLVLIAKALGEILYIPAPLVNYRQHETNVAGSVHRSGMRFIAKKLRSKDDRQTSLLASQCREFALAFEDLLDERSLEAFREFGDIEGKGKLGRVALAVKLGALKQTPSRRIFQLMRI